MTGALPVAAGPAAWLRRKFDEDQNPVAVKEIRQTVRQGAFRWTLLLEMLLLAAVSLGVMLADKPNSGNGRGLALAWSIVAIVSLFLWMAALIAMARTIREGELSGADLLYALPLPPSQHAWGKWQAATLQSLLLVSVALPFAALAYALRGISLVDIGAGAIVLLLQGIIGATLCQMLAVIPLPSWSRFVLAIGLSVWILMVLMVVPSMLLMSGSGSGSIASLTQIAWPILIPLHVVAAVTMRFLLSQALALRSSGGRKRERAFLILVVVSILPCILCCPAFVILPILLSVSYRNPPPVYSSERKTPPAVPGS